MYITTVYFNIGSTARDEHGPWLKVETPEPVIYMGPWLCFPGKEMSIKVDQVWKVVSVPPSKEEQVGIAA